MTMYANPIENWGGIRTRLAKVIALGRFSRWIAEVNEGAYVFQESIKGSPITMRVSRTPFFAFLRSPRRPAMVRGEGRFSNPIEWVRVWNTIRTEFQKLKLGKHSSFNCPQPEAERARKPSQKKTVPTQISPSSPPRSSCSVSESALVLHCRP